ncbi:MAG: DNA mismatch repair endonuclease MutL [Planctomycetaceae bacterium]|nr:DNA mismatch repair endonuclease MutL [Planctomycetaceae bacterium]
MPKIRRLSTSLINKIAAGEVIERPASVVKELLENSLDAGATRIDVAIDKGGTDLIRIADNGCGIDPDDLPLAIASHATSKLVEADDLFRVRTLGFRGEALASIAEISRMVIVSRAADRPEGAELEVVAGEASPIVPRGCPVGTTIEVRNLFFNTPVRRKFLRTTQTELGHITEAFTRVALANPGVHLTLRHNGRVVHDLPPSPPGSDRVARLFGDELARRLIEVESVDGDVRLWGQVAHPSESRGNQRMQYLFLNGRPIRDRSLQHALTEAYRGLLLTGRYPISFLSFEMPADLVDVNVHPTKLEVRFQDGGRLYSQLLATLRTKFLTTDLTTPLTVPAAGAPTTASASADVLAQRAAELGARRELVDWAKSQMSAWDDTPASTGRGSTTQEHEPRRADTFRRDAEYSPAPRAPLGLHRLERSYAPPAGARDDDREPVGLGAGATSAAAWPAPAPLLAPAALNSDESPEDIASGGRPLAAMQIHNRYLVAESSEGVVVIDQHALHERILYEQLSAQLARGDLEAQQLLVPEPVDLSGPDSALVLEHRELLARLGMRVEAFGGGTILISSYPAMLANVSPSEILRELIEQLAAGAKSLDRPAMLDELLHMCACKAAIKAGDPLTPDEIAVLLAQRHRYRDTHHCPHGRPTELVFTREQLDKQFLRT